MSSSEKKANFSTLEDSPSFPVVSDLVIECYDCSITGIRSSNEDAHSIIKTLPKNMEYSFIGLFDGHNGVTAANYSANRLHIILDEEMTNLRSGSDRSPLTVVELQYCIVKSFCLLDDEFLNTRQDSGCTVVIALLDRSRRILTVANAGDSRCILNRVNGRTETCSMDHKPNHRKEEDRILQAKHFVEDGRIDNIIACSRAIGDPFIKVKDKVLLAEKKSLTPYPYVRSLLLADGVSSERKLELIDAFEEREKQARIKERMKKEQKEQYNLFVQMERQKNEEKKKQADYEEKKKLAAEKDGDIYEPPPRVPFKFATRFFFPTSEDGFKNPEPMIINDEDDATPIKAYKFLVIACDGLYDVMSNLEVTEWVNAQLLERDQINKRRLSLAFTQAGLPLPPDLTPPPANSNYEGKDLIYRPLSDIPRDLCQLAIDKKSTDNVSVVIVMLENPPVEISPQDIAVRVNNMRPVARERSTSIFMKLFEKVKT